MMKSDSARVEERDDDDDDDDDDDVNMAPCHVEEVFFKVA
jgi:hypothetical protein